MKRYLKIYLFSIIIIILLFFLIYMTFNNFSSKKEINNVIDNKTGEYNESYGKIKGIINGISEEGIINIQNTYMQENMAFVIDEYSSGTLYFTSNSSILNYLDLSEIKYKDIQNGDILFYEGMIEYSANPNIISPNIDNNNRIHVDNNRVLILKKQDIEKLAIQQYGNKDTLTDVHIVYQTDVIEKYNVRYLFSEIKLKTMREDEIVYCFTMQIDDNTKIINNVTNGQYTNVVLRDKFDRTVISPNFGYIREIKEITYIDNKI